MKGWFGYHSVRCNALHFVGDYGSQLQCANDAIRRFPDRAEAQWFVVAALAAQGRASEGTAALAEAIRGQETLTGYSEGNLIGSFGLELLAHGHGGALAKKQLAKAVAWYEALPPDEARTPAMRRQHAFWLYANGDYEKSYQAYRGIVADLGSVADRGYLGITAGLAGNRAEAVELRAAFLSGDIAPAPELRHFWAALLSAGLDDLDGAAANFKQTWSTLNSHVEPVLLLKMGGHPAFKDYIKPRG